MPKQKMILMPKTKDNLKIMGEQIKMARLRRHLTAELVAKRAGVSRATVSGIEHGKPSIAIGAYAVVLHAINGLEDDLLLIAKDDILGRKLQDLELKTRERGPKRKKEDLL